MSQLEQQNSERVERSREARENKEEQEEKKLAAKERVEVVSREVKTTKQQIQNIVGNMQMVMKAVAAIRAQLQLSQTDGAIPSVERDQKALELLKKKLAGLYSEIGDLKKALLIEEKKNVIEEHGDWPAEQVDQEAQTRVAAALKRLDIESSS